MAIDRTPVLKRSARSIPLSSVTAARRNLFASPACRKESEYLTLQLREKQKVKSIYGVLEKRFHHYFDRARKMNGITGENLHSS